MNQKLDHWDYQLILTVKRYDYPALHSTIAALKKVWAERCAVKLEDVQSIHIAGRLIEIAEQINFGREQYRFSSSNILKELSPYCDWKYQDSGTVATFWERVLIIYASALAHTEVAHIEGLGEYFENVWKKAGKP